MTDYTQNDFAGKVLVDLGQQDPSETIPGAALAYVTDRLTQTLEGLQDEGMVDWDITGSIPGSRVNALLQLFGGLLAPAYGVAVPINPLTGEAIPVEEGRTKLRSLVQGEYVAPDWDRARNF